MPAPPKRLKDLIEGTVDHHASLTYPDLQEVTIRWRGSLGYLIAWAGDGDDGDEQIPLCRIEYLGDGEDWGFALYDPATEKARLSEIAEEVGRTHERVHITKNGKDYVVLLAAEDLESIEATLELLSDPAAQERIAQSRDEIARGEGLSIAEVARSLEERFGKRRP